MITPQFSVDQDEQFVYVKIKAPYIKAQNIEFVVDDNVFIFSLHPYYLRLRFPGRIVDDDERASADYDLGTYMISIKLPKETKGEFFEDLDMISKLLARKNEDLTKPLIVEIGEGKEEKKDHNNDDNNSNKQKIIDEDISLAEGFDWEIEQEVPRPLEEDNDVITTTSALNHKYGFDNGYSGVMHISIMNGNDINDLSDPDKLSPQERTQERIEIENDKFDPDYYLADLMDNPMIPELLNWSPTSNTSDDIDILTTEETDRLARLSNKTYLLDSPKQTYVGLISLIFGACYDKRVNTGDTTVESSWTIGKLCPQLSCLDSQFNTVHSIMVCCTRRALSYPLYRHWELIKMVWDDVYHVLKRGKRSILKVLAGLVLIFDVDLYNVYNQIWLEDYAVWVQYSQENVIRSLAHEVHKIVLKKEDMEFDLLEYEQAALEAMNEEQEIE